MFGRLLAIFAHPDDESYGPAGTLVEAADAGHAVRVVIATRGEAGSLGISRQYEPHELARIRQGELRDAAAILGIESFILGWPDKCVNAVDPDRAVATLVREIRQFRPDSLLTFHPNGLSGHPDHIAMTGLALAAERAAADSSFRPELGTAWSTPNHWHYAIPESKAQAVSHFRLMRTVPDEAVDEIVDVWRHTTRKEQACLAHVTQRDFHRQLQDARGGLHEFWSREHLVRVNRHPRHDFSSDRVE